MTQLPHNSFSAQSSHSESDGSLPHSPEASGNVPQPSESFGTAPHPSAPFGNVPHAAEAFRNVRNLSERSEHHTLTVREVARLFENAGVSRTERSIVNWCQPNRQGVARLDAYFDSNERRYLITNESVARAIEEEKAKQTSGGGSISEEEVPKRSEPVQKSSSSPHDKVDGGESEEFRLQLRDLEITNRVKDLQIASLEKDRERFESERQQYITQMIGMSRRVGELETHLLQLRPGDESSRDKFPHVAERFGTSSEQAVTDGDIQPSAD